MESLRHSSQIFNDQRLRKKEAQLMQERELQRQFDEKYEETTSENLDYVDLSREALGKALSLYIEEIKSIQSKIEKLRKKAEEMKIRPAKKSKEGLKNQSEEAVAKVLLEIGLIVEIGSYSLDQLVKEAMYKNQVCPYKAPHFIQGVQEFHSESPESQNVDLYYSTSDGSLNPEFIFKEVIQPETERESLAGTIGSQPEETKKSSINTFVFSNLAQSQYWNDLEVFEDPSIKLKKKPFLWGKLLSISSDSIKVAVGFEEQIVKIPFQSITCAQSSNKQRQVMVEAFDLTYKIRLKDISDFNRISHGIHSYHRKKQFPPKSHPINPVNPENKKSSL